MTHYWVLAAQPWALTLFHDTLRWLPGLWRSFAAKEQLDYAVAHDVKMPDALFSLHWHWMVPRKLTDSSRCIGFHSSPLPAFRGGSPIQNQLKRGILDTKLTAFRLDAGLDTGPICAQLPLSLRGTKDEVMERIGGLIARMMPRLVCQAYEERPQAGTGSFYTRKDAEDFVWA